MALIVWDRHLEVGHPKIDAQHRSLVDAFNALHQAMKQGKGKEEVGKTLAFLANYTVEHFAMEEGLMRQYAYPAITKHQTLHQDLVAKVGDLVNKVQAGQAMVTLQVMDFLEGWLVEHIQGEDSQLSAYLRGK